MSIEPSNRIRVKTAADLGLLPQAYRYANYGGVVLFAAFEDPNRTGLWWLTSDSRLADGHCPWAGVDEESLARPGIGNLIRRSSLNEQRKKYVGPFNTGSIEVVDVRIENTLAVNIPQLVDLICDTQRSSDFVHSNLPSPAARETMLRSALEDNIENYLAERAVPYIMEKHHE